MRNFLKFLCGVFTLFLFLFSGCKSDEEEVVKLPETNQMLSFKFEVLYNQSLISKDISSTISGQNINVVFLDTKLDKTRLVASFTHNGKRVTVNGVEQRSGVSANDFSKPVVYVVEAADGSKRSYTVNMVLPQLQFISFKFLQKNNPSLNLDVDIDFTSYRAEKRINLTDKRLIATFETGASKVTVNGVEQISGVTENDFSSIVKYTLYDDSGQSSDFYIAILPADVPKIFIETENKVPITSKDYYLNAVITVESESFPSFTANTTIKGRGNSTWGAPKKPYKIKFPKGEGKKMLGMKKARSWVMLANYIDPTLMLNAVAFKIGELMEVPFTNHAEPFDLYVNDKYMGSYMLTEQVEIDNNRVDIDEDNGVLLELDAYFDEQWKFQSKNFNLPVMVKDPDITDPARFNQIKSEFQAFEDAVASPDFPNSNYLDYIDANSLVAYLLTYNLTHNIEINHPKSTYIFKDVEGKYFMGPIWDFDWGFDYINGYHFGRYNTPLFLDYMQKVGTPFFRRFLEDPKIKGMYKAKWAEFKLRHLMEVYSYIDEYANKADGSFSRDAQIWPGSKNYRTSIANLKQWLKNRVSYIDSYVAGL